MKFLTHRMIGLLLIASGIGVISSCVNQQKESEILGTFTSDTVIIESMKFSPAELTVGEGDTITWINKDLVDHNVKDTLKNLFYSDTLKNSHSFRWVVTGKAKYICTIHPTMSGEIILAK